MNVNHFSPGGMAMEIFCWICSCAEIADQKPQLLKQALVAQGVKADFLQPGLDASPGVYLFSEITFDLQRRLQIASRGGLERVIAIAESERPDRANDYWDLLRAGASDILVWSNPASTAREIKARFERWRSIEHLLEGPVVGELVVAKSPVWRAVIRDVAEIARFSDATVLLLGESGTGKEVVARLIHLLDPRPDKRDLVILDCSSITAELSGSEFFGHERGSFTGASNERQGAFALANGGTLFLDEIGELPLPLQAQLLRVIQERTYKRVGGNAWHRTRFAGLRDQSRSSGACSVRRVSFRPLLSNSGLYLPSAAASRAAGGYRASWPSISCATRPERAILRSLTSRCATISCKETIPATFAI